MEYIAGFIIAAAIGACVTRDANSRGMNGRFWGISTILVMIVALPIYLIVRKPRPEASSH
ncbi:MAG: hypothetical protein EOR78_29400 [Mesorhizobium sp.]|nr:MAG: hypothetical protein EOR78_29400 [Mesorhizobium sp.]